VVVHDLHVMRAVFTPHEADAPWVIHADAVLSAAIGTT
jgi:hypothetical protein